jgi:small subunit ribosomal protein S4
MARYIGPKLKISRRFGVKLGLRTNEEAFTRRPYKPGQHGPTARRSRPSEYAIQLLEKAESKTHLWHPGNVNSVANYELASKSDNVGLTLMQLLEMRLDTVVYRAGLALTQKSGPPVCYPRSHLVDGKESIHPLIFGPSPGMQIALEKSLATLVDEQRGHAAEIPTWIKTSKDGFSILDLPAREQIPSLINESAYC